ncbi:MAG: response regulator [Fulvivirga sp.]|nr:response regulator [Fulvivirga sp.]
MKGKIVVIDDTESLLEEVSDLLKMEGYEVFTASNAYKGLTLVNDFAPDVIITDLNMPEMDGFKLISKLKSIKKIC